MDNDNIIGFSIFYVRNIHLFLQSMSKIIIIINKKFEINVEFYSKQDKRCGNGMIWALWRLTKILQSIRMYFQFHINKNVNCRMYSAPNKLLNTNMNQCQYNCWNKFGEKSTLSRNTWWQNHNSWMGKCSFINGFSTDMKKQINNPNHKQIKLHSQTESSEVVHSSTKKTFLHTMSTIGFALQICWTSCLL